ncbi:hypothetical protein HK102_001649 [Quaeritorhiza haematococci]|nr:hypothetical protein HK102_001649 [Quaeritorhiza haematococci]
MFGMLEPLPRYAIKRLGNFVFQVTNKPADLVRSQYKRGAVFVRNQKGFPVEVLEDPMDIVVESRQEMRWMLKHRHLQWRGLVTKVLALAEEERRGEISDDGKEENSSSYSSSSSDVIMPSKSFVAPPPSRTDSGTEV